MPVQAATGHVSSAWEPCWLLSPDTATSVGVAPKSMWPGVVLAWDELLAAHWTQPVSGSVNMPRILSDLSLHPQGLSLIKPASQNRADNFKKKKLRGSHDMKGPPGRPLWGWRGLWASLSPWRLLFHWVFRAGVLCHSSSYLAGLQIPGSPRKSTRTGRSGKSGRVKRFSPCQRGKHSIHQLLSVGFVFRGFPLLPMVFLISR